MQGAQYSSPPPPLALPHPRGISSDPVRYGLSKKKADRWRGWGAAALLHRWLCVALFIMEIKTVIYESTTLHYKPFIVQKARPCQVGKEGRRYVSPPSSVRIEL